MSDQTQPLRAALRRIQLEAVSLADAQVIALESLSASAQPASGDADTGPQVLRQVFELCEATEEADLYGSSRDSQAAQDFMRGRKFEAKQIRKAIGIWFQDEFCGRSFMGEPVTPPASQEQADTRRCIDARNKLNAAIHGDGAVIDDLETAVYQACLIIKRHRASQGQAQPHDMAAMLANGAKAWAGVDAQDLRADGQAQPSGEHVATTYTMEALDPLTYDGSGPRCHVSLLKELPAGTKLYTAPQPVQPAARVAMTDEQRAVLAFLLGSGVINGLSFGDDSPALYGRFWWRKFLREAFGITSNGEADRV